MAEITDVLEALKGVNDPELGKSLVELGMIHDVDVTGDKASFTLALTTMACPLKESIVNDARQAVLALDGVEDVQVSLREMTLEEKKRIWPKQNEQQKKEGVALHLNHIDRVLAVMSGKGGVGKSSVAAMLAVALRRQGKRVGVLDADITGPSIPKMFGLQGAPPAGPVGILPATTSTGILVMSINLLLPNEDDAVVWRGPLIGGAIRQFWGDVVWGNLDVLVLDLPPGTSDASLTVMQSIPINGVVLVTSPQSLAGMVVRKAAQMAEQLKVSLVGVVENMSYAECPNCGERFDVFGPSQSIQTAKQLGVPMLGQLPLDPELARRCDAGEIEAYKADEFEPIADKILERASARASTPIF
ncbi:MAG TPA: iron-sulfur cluster carrier protein ApbC [Chloroflexi bacterium]|nr:iron-sulfur cluster carrier protein ApbC [Chloroflexota bacterium]